jgi:hypothetical protein
LPWKRLRAGEMINPKVGRISDAADRTQVNAARGDCKKDICNHPLRLSLTQCVELAEHSAESHLSDHPRYESCYSQNTCPLLAARTLPLACRQIGCARGRAYGAEARERKKTSVCNKMESMVAVMAPTMRRPLRKAILVPSAEHHDL